MQRSLPERLSKAATLAAVALALPVHLTVDPAVGWPLRVIAAIAGITAFLGARRSSAMTVAVVVGAGPILPALLAVALHVAALNAFYTVWLAALFGALLPGMARDRWELPRTWRLPLGVWGLTLSLAWPVLIVREAGLRLGRLRDTGALDSWAYLNTPQVESWILHVIIAQLVGLLWLEWLMGRVKPTPSNPESPIPNPEVASAAIAICLGASLASIVAIYQGTVNMAFLSGGPWPGLRRAAGTLLDANAYGTVAALAGPIAFVAIPSLFSFLRLKHGRLAQAAALAINWGGAWMSGSRTALVAGAFGTVMLVYGLFRADRRENHATGHEPTRGRHMPWLLAGVAVVVLILAIAAGAIGPLKRMTGASGPSPSMDDLWDRGGYGNVATRMVRDYPLTGVGAGSFNWMAPDYWRLMANEKLPFDNAQNWWRHQVAELGVIASLPILIWSGLIAWAVFTRRSRPGARVETATLRGLLAGLGAASLLGMPTQNPIVLVIFFYLVARFEILTGISKSQIPNPKSQIPTSRLAWLLGVLIAGGYAGGHLLLAHGSLNPSARAALTNRDFVTGTYPAEPLEQGQFRWTRKHATFALAAPSRYLVIRYRVGNPDADSRPVTLRITTPCETLVDERRSDNASATRAFELPAGLDRVVFDTDVSRTWKPSDSGTPDSRVLGAAIEADFVRTPAVVASQERWIPLKSCPR